MFSLITEITYTLSEILEIITQCGFLSASLRSRWETESVYTFLTSKTDLWTIKPWWTSWFDQSVFYWGRTVSSFSQTKIEWYRLILPVLTVPSYPRIYGIPGISVFLCFPAMTQSSILLVSLQNRMHPGSDSGLVSHKQKGCLGGAFSWMSVDMGGPICSFR